MSDRAPSSNLSAENPKLPQVFTRCGEVCRAVWGARAAGKIVGVVPTMGALHEGHLSLVRESNAICDLSIATIFVNPTQFGPKEDFSKYPRTFDNDLRLLATCDTDIVFAPSNEEMYPAGFSTYVNEPAVSQPLEGQCRPGHFRGVTTIVAKLFNAVPADWAFFGQKDFQQAMVIQHMARDLNFPVKIKVCPIVREADGLAMSSRNRYLSPAERQQALAISASLRLAEDLIKKGERNANTVREQMRSVLLGAGITTIEYIALANPETLAEESTIAPGSVALIAARVGTTRLIDNQFLG